MGSGCSIIKSQSKLLLWDWVFHEELKHSDMRVDRTDAILTKPEGKILMQKAWAEALESAKKIDPNFDEELI
jgi:hypothetical protein